MNSFKSMINKIEKCKPNILVIGDIMLDRYIYGEVNKISPEAPIPIVEFAKEKRMLGGCGNVINNLVNLGVNVTLISAIGDDSSGGKIKTQLIDIGVSTSYLFEIRKTQTTLKTRIVGDSQQIARVDYNMNFDFSKYYNPFKEIITDNIDEFDAVIISDYGKGICSQTILSKAIEVANVNSIPVFIDPKGASWNKYRKAYMITPNKKEAELVLERELFTNKDFETAGNEISEKYHIDKCLITRGSSGMSFVAKNQSFNIKSNAKEIFDVSGAGDTVIALITTAIVLGYSDFEASNFANQAAGIVVGHLGTHAIDLKELLDEDK